MIDKNENYGLNVPMTQVKKFHELFNHPVGESPCGIDITTKLARVEWMREEITEYLDATGDIVEEVDALLDLIYFALGTLCCHGVFNVQELFDVIQNHNLQKLFPDGKPHYRADGKTIKPSTWESPHNEEKEFIEKLILESKSGKNE